MRPKVPCLCCLSMPKEGYRGQKDMDNKMDHYMSPHPKPFFGGEGSRAVICERSQI